MTVKYQAYAKGSQITRDTPRAAALAYFEMEPTRRKCDVAAGTVDGAFFVRTYRLGGCMPASWRDVTRKTALALPDVSSAGDIGGAAA